MNSADPKAVKTELRLQGWKEISTYLGRGVRTAQRWEKDAGLPVRRVGPPGGEGVFAFREEIDAWLLSAKGRRASNEVSEDAPNGESPPPVRSTALRRSLTWGGVAVSVAIVVAIMVVAWPRSSVPGDWDIRNGRVVVQDTDGTVLWTPDMPPLTIDRSWSKLEYSARAAVSDVDGDGTPEVLIAHEGEAPALYCFGSDSRLRFKWVMNRRMEFGDGIQTGTFTFTGVMVDKSAGGRARVWTWGHHVPSYASFLQRLEVPPSGDPVVVGEYWSSGYILQVVSRHMGGRDSLLVGAALNDDANRGASLAVFFDGRIGGSAPVVSARKSCRNCPSGTPARFFAFPRGPIGEAIDPELTAEFYRFEGVSNHGFTAVVTAANTGLLGHSPPERVLARYTFDAAFNLVTAQLNGNRPAMQQQFEAAGYRLKRPWTEQSIFPVLSWNGKAFEEVQVVRK